MMIVVFSGREVAMRRRRRKLWCKRRREMVLRRVLVARVLYWIVRRRESVPEGVESMRLKWEIVASDFLR